MCLGLSVGHVGYLSPQACPGGSEVDLCNHGNSIWGDEGGGIPCCHEETEVLIVIYNFVSYLNHISRTCVWVCVSRLDRKKESLLTAYTVIQACGHDKIYLHPFTFSSALCLRDVCNAALLCRCLHSFFSSCSTSLLSG